MIRNDLEAALREKLQDAAPIGASILFDLGSDGSIFLDGKANPPTVSETGNAPDTTITLAASDLKHLMAGEMSAMDAYTTGKLDVVGDMAPAMKLGSLLS